MLVAGLLLNNVPFFHESVGSCLDPALSSVLRKMALVVILIRAGLGLDPAALRKLPLVILNLSLSPCVAEAGVVALLAAFCLDIPWLWAAMMGFLLSAVSPAVVVPCLLTLQEKGFGVDQGIPTLVIASASCNDVIAIAAFTILLGISFNPSTHVAWTALQAPIEVLLGVGWGIFWGLLCAWFPPKSNRGPSSTFYRIILLIGGSLIALFGSSLVHFPGAGALAVLVMGFVAGREWRKGSGAGCIPDIMAGLWVVFQPLLFDSLGQRS